MNSSISATEQKPLIEVLADGLIGPCSLVLSTITPVRFLQKSIGVEMTDQDISLSVSKDHRVHYNPEAAMISIYLGDEPQVALKETFLRELRNAKGDTLWQVERCSN